MNERRRAGRIDFDGEAVLLFQQDRHDVELQDISISGARVICTTPLALPDDGPVTLEIAFDDSDLTLTLPGRVIRQAAMEVGIHFERPSVDAMQHLRRLVALHKGDDGEDDPASMLNEG